MNRSCHAYKVVMSHDLTSLRKVKLIGIWMSHVTKKEWCHTHVNGSCHSYKRVMSHVCRNHVTRAHRNCIHNRRMYARGILLSTHSPCHSHPSPPFLHVRWAQRSFKTRHGQKEGILSSIPWRSWRLSWGRQRYRARECWGREWDDTQMIIKSGGESTWERERLGELKRRILAKNASDRERSTKECTSTFMVDVFILFYQESCDKFGITHKMLSCINDVSMQKYVNSCSIPSEYSKYTHTYIQVIVTWYIYRDTRTHTHAYVYRCIRTYSQTNMQMNIYEHTCMCMYICVCVCVCACTYIYIYLRIFIRVHRLLFAYRNCHRSKPWLWRD